MQKLNAPVLLGFEQLVAIRVNLEELSLSKSSSKNR